MGPLFIILISIVALAMMSAFRILYEYERAVVFTFGRFWGVKGPGIIIIIPGVQTMSRLDMRTVVMDVPSQDVISRDNVSIRVNAVVYFRIVDPARAIIQVENYYEATSQLAQTTLRSVLGQHELDDILSERDKLNRDIQIILDEQADPWGVKVANVEIKRVDLDESMVRAIAKQAEAERERRAKVIYADGELQASTKMMEAAKVLAEQPESLQLRYLQTLSTLAGNKTSTLVLPIPIELLKGLAKLGGN